jgi:glyoxylase-like metal-dependent hydrolase (beta-lactamase superfamily II)
MGNVALNSADMLRIERYDDVTRVHMTTWRGQSVGYDVSAYLTRGVLVDTGFAHVADDFARFLEANTIHGVVVTHWHEDHAGNAALAAARRLPIAISPLTLAQLNGSAAASIRFYRRFVWGIAPRQGQPSCPSPATDCALSTRLDTPPITTSCGTKSVRRFIQAICSWA